MEIPKISVIVPVYNTEKYLPKCIDSVLAQVEKDFELLLIDDGSTDGSGKICDKYQAKDSRIKVFHEQNGGVSAARNKGLDEAKGEWIFFLDSDDYIDENGLTIPEEYADADVIVKPVTCIYGIADSTNKVVRKTYQNGNRMYSNDIDIWRTFVENLPILSYCVWARLLHRNVIKDIRFDIKIKMHEDVAFINSIIQNIHKYAFSNLGSYFIFNVTEVHHTLSSKLQWINLMRFLTRLE